MGSLYYHCAARVEAVICRFTLGLNDYVTVYSSLCLEHLRKPSDQLSWSTTFCSTSFFSSLWTFLPNRCWDLVSIDVAWHYLGCSQLSVCRGTIVDMVWFTVTSNLSDVAFPGCSLTSCWKFMYVSGSHNLRETSLFCIFRSFWSFVYIRKVHEIERGQLRCFSHSVAGFPVILAKATKGHRAHLHIPAARLIIALFEDLLGSIITWCQNLWKEMLTRVTYQSGRWIFQYFELCEIGKSDILWIQIRSTSILIVQMTGILWGIKEQDESGLNDRWEVCWLLSAVGSWKDRNLFLLTISTVERSRVRPW